MDVRSLSVLAYFGDDPDRVYQLIQWLPVLELLDAHESVGIVLQDPETATIVRARTTLPVLFAADFGELRDLYAELDAKVALYCNNSTSNFDSLLETRMLHVHINHGESDKQSMASNNAKSYDRVFVAGQAAVERYALSLLEFDTDRLVRIGRPQLDLERVPALTPSPRRTVLYAPTWEADADYNNYSSVDTIGTRIVQQLLDVPDVRLVYKPHPRVVISADPGIGSGHREILDLVARAAALDPAAGHLALLDADILAVMPACDAMVTDVSSVGLDWLYLRTERPLFIADRHHDPERLRLGAPVSRCADVLDSQNVHGLTELLTARLEHDELYAARIAMRNHYFDGVKVGDSTARFVEAVGALARLRDTLLPDGAEEAGRSRPGSQRPRSRSTRWLASPPGEPVTQPPGWLPEPHR
ncbi:MAG: hypothetical protein QOD98_3689 [Nocardioidaceae bacterium]|nr:hypothetical protein [Nocardioidaceae bacterium]